MQTLHSDDYTPRDMKLDLGKIKYRMSREGMSFLLKTLPRLGKAFDRALTGEVPFDCTGFRKESGVKLPLFMGSLFKRVFHHNGRVLPTPCVRCIATIRQVLYLFYKYEIAYDTNTEKAVIEKFEKTDRELLTVSATLQQAAASVDCNVPLNRQSFDCLRFGAIISRARCRLNRLFCAFDPRDITPSHGPGAVSTRETLWNKWTFSNVSPRITQSYPLDEYYYSSLSHVCDELAAFQATTSLESPARVVLVPKDSRGPRLISCEPLDFQWIQQGLSRAIVRHVERHPLTRCRVNFTDQRPNQIGALWGSETGKYATLDLNEASDRVSIGLVDLLFPENVKEHLMNCRSLSTELPGGRIINLNKYAPMGSALCFPVLALSVWAILTAGAPDADTRERVLVYGDDVVVPTAYAAHATELLESVGLKVNLDKSCTSGFFRESCGVDAYRGVEVTPIRLRTVWSSSRCPHSYASWVAYANSFYHKKFFNVYDHIVAALTAVYREIPEGLGSEPCPSLVEVPAKHVPKQIRTNPRGYQIREQKVWVLQPVTVIHEIEGWKMLFRYFTEKRPRPSRDDDYMSYRSDKPWEDLCDPPYAVRSYTKRRAVKLIKRWVPLNA